MAKLVVENPAISLRKIPSYVEILIVGAVSGLLWWPLASGIARYIPDVAGPSGALALIIIAVCSLLALIWRRVPRPIFITISAALVLWPLGSFIGGLSWTEVYIWSLALCIATYSLFGVVTKLRSLGFAVLVAAIIILAIRLALIL